MKWSAFWFGMFAMVSGMATVMVPWWVGAIIGGTVGYVAMRIDRG